MLARILVVDPDRSMRESLAILLRNAGYVVALAEDGISAGYSILDTRPDLVIYDAELPPAYGFDLFTTLQQDADLRQIPIVVLATSSDRLTPDQELGAAGWLAKPVKANALLALVAKHLNRRLAAVA
jgi:DNA-binding response OmpR family regulator